MKKRLQAWGDTKIIDIVGAFVFNEYGELFLLKRHSEDLGGGKWGTPGGRIEVGETAAKAMQREFSEETGLTKGDFTELGCHEIRMPHGTVRMISYKTIIPKNSYIMIDPEEHTSYKWFSCEGLNNEDNILWGVPSILRDYHLIKDFDVDSTLADGSSVKLLELAK